VVIDLAAINGLLYAQLKTATAGAPLRAALVAMGASVASIIPAEKLRVEPRPARVLLAWRGGSVGGQSGDMRPISCVWWLYDDPAQGYARIDALVPLIEAAYPLECVAWGETRVSFVGQATEDATLGGLLVRPLQLTHRRLS
jgi:hypothetical protein